jgi:outer membrane protein assembly factor BamB
VSEVQRATVAFPGGLTARFRWGGSAVADEMFALSEDGGAVVDHAALAGSGSDRLCRAELRAEGPRGVWTARFASPIFDAPAGLVWDSEALLVIKYGFLAYALASRDGELRWSHRAGTPLVAVLGSPRLPHVLVQGEVETLALDAAGEVRWRVAHADVVRSAELLGGQLVLMGYGDGATALDPLTGRALASRDERR